MTGLAWMALAQLLFAGMNVCTRLSARDLPWPEIAAVRFLVGAIIAITMARRSSSRLSVRDRRSAWRRSGSLWPSPSPVLWRSYGRPSQWPFRSRLSRRTSPWLPWGIAAGVLLAISSKPSPVVARAST